MTKQPTTKQHLLNIMTALSIYTIDKRLRLILQLPQEKQLRLLIDTGANVSILTIEDYEQLEAPTIYAAIHAHLSTQLITPN